MAGFRHKYSQLCKATENLLFAIIMLLLIHKNLECLRTAPFVLSVPLLCPACRLTVQHPLSPPRGHLPQAGTHPIPTILAEGSWTLCSQVKSSLSSALSVTYMDTIGSSQSTPLRSIGTKIAFFFHSSICWTQQTTCHYVCFKSKQNQVFPTHSHTKVLST